MKSLGNEVYSGLNNAITFEGIENGKYPGGLLIWTDKGIGLIQYENLLKMYRKMYRGKDILCLRNSRDDKRIKNCKFPHEWIFVKNVESANDMDYVIMKPWMTLYNVQRNEYMISSLTENENYGGILYVENGEIKVSTLKIDSMEQGFGSVRLDGDMGRYKISIYNGTKYLYFGLSDEKIDENIYKLKLYENKDNENVINFKIGRTNKDKNGFSFNLMVLGYIDASKEKLKSGI